MTEQIAADRLEYLERAILESLDRRAPEATICPAEIAQQTSAKHWRELMGLVRDAAWRLEAAGRVVILQRGRPVRRAGAIGPIRIMLAGDTARRTRSRYPVLDVDKPRARRKNDLQRKICANCGRPFAWRRKWASCWDNVQYCSDDCIRARRERGRGA